MSTAVLRKIKMASQNREFGEIWHDPLWRIQVMYADVTRLAPSWVLVLKRYVGGLFSEVPPVL